MNIGAALTSIGVVVVLAVVALMLMDTPFGWGFGIGALVIATLTAVFCSRAVVEDEQKARARDPLRIRAIH